MSASHRPPIAVHVGHRFLFFICCTCLYAAYEKDLPDTEVELILWRAYNKCKKTFGGKRPTGLECYGYEFKEPNASQQNLLIHMQESETLLRDDVKSKARDNVRKRDKDARQLIRGQVQQHRVVEQETKFKEDFADGYFLLLDQFLAMTGKGASFANMELSTNCRMELNTLPHGAEYKFRRGSFQVNAKISAEDFSDSNEADDTTIFADSDLDHGQPKHIAGLKHLTRTSADHVPPHSTFQDFNSIKAILSKRLRSAMSGAASDDDVTSIFMEEGYAELEAPVDGKMLGKRSASDISEIEMVPVSRQPVEVAKSLDPSVAASATAISVNIEKQKLPYKNKKLSPQDLLQMTEQLFEKTSRNYDAKLYWEQMQKFKSRDISRSLGRMRSVASRCAAQFHDEETSAKLHDIAAKWMGQAEFSFWI